MNSMDEVKDLVDDMMRSVPIDTPFFTSLGRSKTPGPEEQETA